ncbi:hypothetical protein BGX34_005089 [Mortierella sp. NVP85]|nr:hypothetical protein BGX34_005089 [Mortierella sp. NVP85]
MSSEVAAPSTSSSNKARRSLASFKTMFGSKKNLIDQSSGSAPSSPTVVASESTVNSPTTAGAEPSSTKQGSVASMIASSSKRAVEKAAAAVTPTGGDKDKKDQPVQQQEIQLSTVDEHGAFVPPPPAEKGYKEHVTDNDVDFFQTIISTPPERIRTLLSAASTISPGMFSSPSSKIKRHSLVSFPSHSISYSSGSRSSHEFADESSSSSMASSLSSSPTTAAPKQQQQQQQQVQIACLSGSGDMEEDLNEALSESMTGSMVAASFGGRGASRHPSSPSQDSVPELTEDDDDPSSSSGTESLSSSVNASPRQSTTSRFQRPFSKRKGLHEVSLDIEMPLAH